MLLVGEEGQMKKEWNDLEQKESHVAKEWQNLEQQPDRTNAHWLFQEKPLENAIDDPSVRWTSWILRFLCIGEILLSIAVLGYFILCLVAAVIIGTDLCV